jgi:hypothetical protein
MEFCPGSLQSIMCDNGSGRAMGTLTKTLLFISLFFCPRNVSAQPVDKDVEPAAIVELGGAAGRDLKGGASSFGGDLAV